jgi:hypothetical protein
MTALVEGRYERRDSRVTSPPAFHRDHELTLLLACCRVRPTEADLIAVGACAAQVQDWSRLLRLARRHQVTSLVAETLAAAQVVTEESAGFQTSRRRNAKRALSLSVELCQLLDLLREAGVTAAPYKGLALAEALYGGIDRRGVGDLDLLLRPEDLPAAEAVLLARGYARYRYSRVAEAHDRVFVRATDQLSVELHLSLKSPCAGTARPVGELWPELIPTTVVGRVTLGFPPELLLVLLAEHGARHAWERLKWLCDIAELLRATPELDWDRLGRLIQRPDSRRALELAVMLAQTALDAPRFRCGPQTRPGRGVKWMAGRVMRDWGQDSAGERSRLVRWADAMVLTEGGGPRLRASSRLLREAAWPASAEEEWASLPRWQAWGYPGLRMVRVAARALSNRSPKKDQPTG